MIGFLALLLSLLSLYFSLMAYAWHRRRYRKMESDLRGAIQAVGEHFNPDTRIPAKVLQQVLLQVHNGDAETVEWETLLIKGHEAMIWYGSEKSPSPQEGTIRYKFTGRLPPRKISEED